MIFSYLLSTGEATLGGAEGGTRVSWAPQYKRGLNTQSWSIKGLQNPQKHRTVEYDVLGEMG